jgi:hypothetical protein
MLPRKQEHVASCPTGECPVKAILASAALILTLAAPAYAQSTGSKAPTPEQMMDGKTPDVIEKEQEADRAYKESLKKIPDAKASTDPWGSARGTDTAKPATKPAAAKKPVAKSVNSAKQ